MRKNCPVLSSLHSWNIIVLLFNQHIAEHGDFTQQQCVRTIKRTLSINVLPASHLCPSTVHRETAHRSGLNLAS